MTHQITLHHYNNKAVIRIIQQNRDSDLISQKIWDALRSMRARETYKLIKRMMIKKQLVAEKWQIIR